MIVAERNLLGSTLTPTGLDIPPDIGVDSWEAIGRRLGEFRDASSWGLGDWLVFGERAFGEDRVAQAIEVTGRSKSTLLKYRWVAERIPPDERWEGLTFTHHEIVAKMTRGDRQSALLRAVSNGWSVEELRGHVRPDKPQIECTCVVDPECPKHGG